MTSKLAPAPPTHAVIRRLVLHVREHLDASWTLDELAARSGYAKHHFARSFREAMGVAPLEYVRLLRLHRAALKVASGNADDLQRVAREAGYASLRAFRRAFDREFEMTPSLFREAHVVAASQGSTPLPAGLDPKPVMNTLGPWRGAALSTRDFSDENLYALLPLFLQATGHPLVPYAVGSASPAMGWSGAQNRREFRYIWLSDEVPPTLERWRSPPYRYATFSFAGAMPDVRAIYDWIFVTWLPRSRYAYAFADVITLYDPGVWYESQFARGQARVSVPIEPRTRAGAGRTR